MECSEVQKRLSAYIEGVISSEEKVLIDVHLKSCKGCKEALADLEKAIEYVKGLQEIEPPPWLTQKIMMRIKSEAGTKRRILQRLFYPLHIKLPIEAIAVVLIAVSTIYIFKTIQPEMRLAKAPSEKLVLQAPSQEKEVPVIDEDRPASKESFMFKEEKEIAAGRPEPSAEVVEGGEVRTLGAPPLRAKRLTMQEGISLTLYVKDIKTATEKVERVLLGLAGRVTEVESFENKNVITAKLDSNKVKNLFKRLELIGEIKSKVKASGAKGEVKIRVEIIKR